MATRYIRNWEDLEGAVTEEADPLEADDDLIFQVAGCEISVTVIDRSERRRSASSEGDS